MTRKEYMESPGGDKSHQKFYGQFVTHGIRDYVQRTIGLSTIMESTNEHFNDIPLKIWDSMTGANFTISNLMNKIGEDYLTLAGQVCTLKEAARQIRDKERCGHE